MCTMAQRFVHSVCTPQLGAFVGSFWVDHIMMWHVGYHQQYGFQNGLRLPSRYPVESSSSVERQGCGWQLPTKVGSDFRVVTRRLRVIEVGFEATRCVLFYPHFSRDCSILQVLKEEASKKGGLQDHLPVDCEVKAHERNLAVVLFRKSLDSVKCVCVCVR